MIPTIEEIVAGLIAGTIAPQKAIAWLNKHTELSALASLSDDSVRVPGPDPEQDFEGFVTAAMEEAIANLPTENKMENYVLRSAQRLLKFVELKAPTFVIEREKRILQRRAGELPVYCEDYDALAASEREAG
jgi:hypothetical protein